MGRKYSHWQNTPEEVIKNHLNEVELFVDCFLMYHGNTARCYNCIVQGKCLKILANDRWADEKELIERLEHDGIVEENTRPMPRSEFLKKKERVIEYNKQRLNNLIAFIDTRCRKCGMPLKCHIGVDDNICDVCSKRRN